MNQKTPVCQDCPAEVKRLSIPKVFYEFHAQAHIPIDMVRMRYAQSIAVTVSWCWLRRHEFEIDNQRKKHVTLVTIHKVTAFRSNPCLLWFAISFSSLQGSHNLWHVYMVRMGRITHQYSIYVLNIQLTSHSHIPHRFLIILHQKWPLINT